MLLAGLTTMPVSPAAVERNDDNPVDEPARRRAVPREGVHAGTEPDPHQEQDYWNAKNTKLAGIEYVQAPIGPPAINDLRAGSVDAIGSDITQLRR